jgi:site-specific DNA recombinase
LEQQKKVTTIPASISKFTAAPIDKPVKRKVAGYARVSTDHDEQFTSYEAQIDYYTKYIQSRDDWEFVKVYTDEGISGTGTKKRVGFRTMIDDALAGKIDLIVTKSVSRFARNTVDSLSTIRELKDHGVECYFEKENIWTFDGKGELLITIMSSLAQEESRSISENCTWGQRKRFADGKVSVPFSRFLGYDKGPNGGLVINPKEAETIRKIYRLFLQGMTPYGISKRLSEDGDLSPSHSTKWNATTVKRILSNEKYKGDALLQKTYTVDYLTKKTKVNEGEIPQYYVEGDHEAIIEPAVFDEVQIELERRCPGKNRHSGVRDFSGMIFCGECGSQYGSKVWHSTDKYRKVIWQCNHKYSGSKKCHTPHLTDDEIKAAFVSAANKVLASRQKVIETFRQIKDATFDTTALEREKDELTAEVNLIAGQIQDGIYQNAHVAQNQAEYEKTYEALSARYEKAKARLDEVTATIHDKNSRCQRIEYYLELLEKQKEPLEKYDARFWHGMVDHVTVYAKDDIRFTMKDGMEVKA